MSWLNRIVAVILVYLIATFSAEIAYAQKQLCTTAEGKRALDEADMLRSWDALYGSYKKFRHCDDGAIAEGYSESVARILVDHWTSLPHLAELASRDAVFRSFVIRHLNATLNSDDIEKVKKNASTRCPPDLQKTCKDLAKQADSALNETSSP